MEDYRAYPDEELVGSVCQENPKIMDYLMDKYKDLVKRKARPLYLMGGDQDDLIQEGMIGLFKAVRDYDKSKGMSFNSFAQLCITRQMYTAVEASNRKKHTPLNSYISLYSGTLEQDDGKVPLQDVLPALNGANPEEMVICQENTRQMEKELNKRLSAYERQILEYYLSGKDYQEIAELLGKAPKSVDNALQRIRKKMSRL